ncbi:tellurite resistance TerB family protein [Hyphomonadaceae bacterium ML37]|nr:tellurite resistance TerB family protein [Hyphomonadaceae bacterium ML37]
MIDFNRIVDALQNDPAARNATLAGGGGFAAGLATSMLMGGSGRKFLGKAAKYGAIAAVGGLAYHAWQNHQRNSAASAAASAPGAATLAPTHAIVDYEAAPAGTAFLPAPDDAAAQEALGQALVRAMIAAAKADGKIDPAEKTRIFERLSAMQLDSDAKAFVFDELNAPLDLNAVVAGAATPEMAAEIYAASLVAIECETPAEAAYLKLLAARLGLEASLVAEIHAAAGAPAPA